MASLLNALFFAFCASIFYLYGSAQNPTVSVSRGDISPRFSVNCSNSMCDFTLEIEEFAIRYVDTDALTKEVDKIMDLLKNVDGNITNINSIASEFFNQTSQQYQIVDILAWNATTNATYIENEVNNATANVIDWYDQACKYLAQAKCFADGGAGVDCIQLQCPPNATTTTPAP